MKAQLLVYFNLQELEVIKNVFLTLLEIKVDFVHQDIDKTCCIRMSESM